MHTFPKRKHVSKYTSSFSVFVIGIVAENLDNIDQSSVSVNLCRTKPSVTASQSSTYDMQVALKVVDGNRGQDFTICAQTKVDQQPPAWVKVDLGGTFSLSHVVIYYRTQSYWKPFRFRQYYLEAETSTSQRIRCYTDTTPESSIPSAIQNKTCKVEARYVIVGTVYDAPEDSLPGPVLEICEIEVYGCDVGHYGEQCLPCPGCSKCDVNSGVFDIQCSNTCIRGLCDDSGLCIQGCNSGYWGNNCTERCPTNCYGNNCHNNGTCIACISNYTGNMCESRLCQNCVQQICATDTGRCINGCRDGYYGYYCTEICSDRCNSTICNRYTGDCTENCVDGYYGSKCETPCSTTCSSKSCRKDDGACLNGCTNGFLGLQCQQQCIQQCKNTSCDISSGHCVGGCNEGFYGTFCNLTCSSKCASRRCNQLNGFCSDGCLPNWSGNTCDAIQQLLENNSNTEVYSALYVVITILFISIFLNIFLIIRNVRQAIYRRQNTENARENCQPDSKRDANKPIYDSVEDNTGYHELGELSQPSHYDQLSLGSSRPIRITKVTESSEVCRMILAAKSKFTETAEHLLIFHLIGLTVSAQYSVQASTINVHVVYLLNDKILSFSTSMRSVVRKQTALGKQNR